MKPTDEEIEKAARQACWVTGEHKTNQQIIWEQGAKHVLSLWPNLKPLKWQLQFQNWRECRYESAETPMGTYYVSSMHGWSDTEQEQWHKCDSMEHGKQLAQADYEKRISELYES